MFNTKVMFADYLNSLLDTAYEQSNGDTHDKVWNELYDFIFSKNVSKMIFSIYDDFNYHDTDTTYYADVVSFIRQFDDYAKQNY